VNVEPRWSPDGTRLAFVSTAFNGRWHIFVGNVRHDIQESQTTATGVATVTRLGGIRFDSLTRITEDRDSGLPRYYYSVFDHYLSPHLVSRRSRADLRVESRADLRDRWNLQVGSAPVGSREDAEYFLRWLDRVDDALRTEKAWNTAAEREEVMRMLEAARAEFGRKRML
jgi:hypothetical protein